MIGKIYGCLEVLRKAPHFVSSSGRKYKQYYTKCLLCGLESEKTTSNIKARPVSCSNDCGGGPLIKEGDKNRIGEQRKRININRLTDRTGDEIGLLTVKEYAYHELMKIAGKPKWKPFWICHCNACGKDKPILGDSLGSKLIKTCGCKWKNNFRDIKGEIFGRLKVIKFIGVGSGGHRLWDCKCNCGKESFTKPVEAIMQSHLESGHTKSCGCLTKEMASEINRTHGMTGTPEYKAYTYMIGRLRQDADYKHIEISPDWEGENGFENFYNDMGNCPKGKTSVDRIDNSKGYFPDNCRWANNEEQNRNRSHVVLYTYRGSQYTSTQLAVLCPHGFTSGSIVRRIKRGMSVKDAVEKRPRNKDRKGGVNTSHGHTQNGVKSPTYCSWQRMKRRVRTNSNYKKIKICDEWLEPRTGFSNFLADMGERPRDCSLDRIDPKGNYERNNCRWADKDTQATNKSVVKKYSFEGKLLTAGQIAKEIGVASSTFSKRIAELSLAETIKQCRTIAKSRKKRVSRS